VRDGRLADLIVVGPLTAGETAPQRHSSRRAGHGRAPAAPRPRNAAAGDRPPRRHRLERQHRGAKAVARGAAFLAKAEAVTVLTVRTARTRSSEGERLVDYLAWHGIKASSGVLQPDGESVGAVLLDAAATFGADLFVMGGYVQSRLQEFLLAASPVRCSPQPTCHPHRPLRRQFIRRSGGWC